MDDPGEGPAPDAEAGGGIVSFLTSLRGVVSTIAALVIAIGGLITALNQVGILGDDEEAVTTNTTTTETTTALFGPVTRPNGRVYFDGNVMYVRASSPGRPLLHLADRGEPLADVSMSARTVWVSGARDYGVGLVCRYENAANYYLLSVLSEGRYNIVRYRNGKGESLTRGIQTGYGPAEGANDVYAKCAGDDPATLTLTVNGRELATVRDGDGIGSGIIGVRVGSSESFVTLRFESFVLREL
jgi:hypothetical protein